MRLGRNISRVTLNTSPGRCMLSSHSEEQSLWALRQTSKMGTRNECHRHSRLLTWASRRPIEPLGKSFSNSWLLISVMVGVGTEPWEPKEWVCSLLEALLIPVSHSSCLRDPAILFSLSGSLRDWHVSLEGREVTVSVRWMRQTSLLIIIVSVTWDWCDSSMGSYTMKLEGLSVPPPHSSPRDPSPLAALKSISGLRGRRGTQILFFLQLRTNLNCHLACQAWVNNFTLLSFPSALILPRP